jgi:GcrA cell cycle regulator
MEWTGDAIDRLRGLWAEGHSTAEIGRRMGISKNAVVGKAHRLNLPARPSPIRREGEGGAAARPKPPRRLPQRVARPFASPIHRIERMPSPPATPRPPLPVPTLQAPRPASPPPAPAAAPASSAAVVRPFPRSGTRHCCWPMGEPGTAEFRFCGGDALPQKPYCADHAAIAYVKVRDRRDDAA